MTENSHCASSTVRAIGPRDCSTVTSTSSDGMRSGVGRKPTTPQHDAGMRIEPPVSPPSATEHMPAATAAPLPPLDPPGVMPCLQGLCVGPDRGLLVPIDAPSSGGLVLPRMGMPADRAGATGTTA